MNTKKIASSIFSFALMASTVLAQETKKEQDKEAIKDMCGCYQVNFDYAETFAADTSYKLHDQYHAMAPAEWIFVAEESEDRIIIQHLLVINDSIIIKHWRQDWEFESTDLYAYNKDLSWKYTQLSAEEVKGQWTQKVYQVDDSPRYQGNATWVFVDGRKFWESTSDNPLPRREYTKRSDYNVMRRTNHHEILPTGWVHEQDNKKVKRTATGDEVLVGEKGLNMYTKIATENCAAAQQWWQQNEAYWTLVRAEWDQILAEKQDLNIAHKRNNKVLWKALTKLGKQAPEMKKKALKKEIHTLIASYLVEENTTEARAK